MPAQKKQVPAPRFITKGRGQVVHALSERLALRLGIDMFECDIEGNILPCEEAPPEMINVNGNLVPAIPPEPSAEDAAEMAGSPPPVKKGRAKKDE
jgi:hypothetical protein